jgi:hypothetical protein
MYGFKRLKPYSEHIKIISDHNKIKQEINNNKIFGTSSNIWMINNKLFK